MSRFLKLALIMVFAVSFSFTASADSSSIMNSRIIGGTQASTGEFPFQVGLIRQSGNSYSFFCGGTIISSTWVVTASHCFDDYDATHVISGTTITNPLDANYLTPISRIIKHPGYNPSVGAQFDNDIALIELATAIPSAPVSTVSTTSAPGFSVDTLATVTGWGDTDSSSADNYPSNLMKVNVPVVSAATCTSAYNAATVTDNMICAGYSTGGYDACQGDSGGPLFVQNSDNTDTLIGIVSWGVGCAQPNQYGVYTKVANYYDWIQTTSGVTLNSATGSGENVSTTLFDTVDTAVAAIATKGSFEINTSVSDAGAGTFVGAADASVSVNTYTIGGEIGSIAITNNDDQMDLSYTTFAKVDVTVNTEDGKDAAIVIGFPSGQNQSKYKFARCPFGVTNFLTCGIMSESDITRDSTGNWAMLYLKNNDQYDGHTNLLDVISEDRAIGDDRIETDIYIVRDTATVLEEEAEAAIGNLLGGAGGGCSAGNGTAYGLTVLIFFCVVYLMRRKMMSNIKENQQDR